MERVFLSCFPPLRRGKPSSSSTADIDEAVKLFSSLITDIDRLQTSLRPEGSVSLKWCSEATNLLRKIHFQMLLCYEKVPCSWDGINILEEYMKETLDLLDLCNCLKSAISGMGRYRLMVDIAIGKFCDDDEIPEATAMTEIERLESGSKKIYGVEMWKDMNLFEITGMPKTKIRFIYAIKSTITVMGKLIFSAVLYPVSNIGKEEEVYREFPQLKLFSVSLGRLVDCFLKGKDDTRRQVLVENKVVEKAVLDIKEEVLKGKEARDQERLRKSIDLLKKSSSALKEGVEMFEAVVNKLFEEVVNGRNKILAMLNAN